MNVLEGDWYDGASSRARRVRIERDADGALRFGSDGEERRYLPGEIALNSRLGTTPRVLGLPDGGRIECADSPLFDIWFPVPGSRIETWADWLERRRGAILVAAVATVLLVAGFFRFGVPWAATQIAARMPRGVEVAASDQALVLLGRMGLEASRLPAGRQAALQARFRALVAGEPRNGEMRLQFAHAPGFGPNAFALPDGRLYVTDQLVGLAGADEEILAVLAHEAGHHVHRHGMRQAIESSSVVVVVGLMLGDASGSSVVASIPSVLLSSGFSRGHEREADRYAFALLERQGIAPAAFARIMQRLGEVHGMDDGTPGWLSTHPPTPERIRAATGRGRARPQEGDARGLPRQEP